jgi:tRNA (mo5U34)-methyltransferase
MSYPRRVVSKILRRLPYGRHWRADAKRKVPETLEARELYEKVAAVPFWFHSIDLGNGVITPGIKSPEHHKKELASLRLPDLRGKSVIDIGAWDGFYSFTAERLGAARVVALDSHVWALDQAAKNRYKAECRKKGVPQQHPAYIPELWCFDKLPGKRGFDLARLILHSQVEPVFGDITKMDPRSLGEFDVVLCLGVLYHMENPLQSLRFVRQLTREVAVIETEAVATAGYEDRPIFEFFPLKAKLMDDPTNFFAPNAAAVIGLCETAGFSKVELLTPIPSAKRRQIKRYRLVAHAFVNS